MKKDFPWLRVMPVIGDFSRPLELPQVRPYARRVAYFPGSTIGNLTPEQAHAFLRVSRGQAARMLVGVDVRKDANVLHAAYNDARGVTAAFNLNLLKRINLELRGNFDLGKFAHYAFYNPAAGRIEMHLVALERHTVRVGAHRFEFDVGESIHTENSYKYSVEGFRALAGAAGFRTRRLWSDRRGLFALHGLEA